MKNASPRGRGLGRNGAVVVRVRSKVHDALRKRGAPSDLVPFARPRYARTLDPDCLAHLLSAVEEFFSLHTPPVSDEVGDAG